MRRLATWALLLVIGIGAFSDTAAQLQGCRHKNPGAYWTDCPLAEARPWSWYQACGLYRSFCGTSQDGLNPPPTEANAINAFRVKFANHYRPCLPVQVTMSSEYQPVAGSPTPHYNDRREFRVDTGRYDYSQRVPPCVPWSFKGNFVHRGRDVGCFPGHRGAYRDTDGTLRCVRADGPCAPTDVNRTFGCGKTVADLEAVAKAPDDPTRVFHQTQTCIARKSCDLRCRMDNCKWMDRVIPDFVNPYLQKAGDWLEIEQRCGAMARMGVPFNSLLCASLMAQYHIEKDLTAALTLHGCGSENDWNLVFSTIQACPSSGGKVAEVAVRDLREQARATCLVRRQTAPDPLIEIPLKGKTCDQQQ